MSTIWHPYTEPPSDSRRVRLRFGDDGKRDCNGFYSAAFGGYYKGKTGFYQHSPVHPTHWAELEQGEAVSKKHQAAKQLLQAAEQMRDLLTEQADGTHIWQMIRTVVGNARAIEMSVAMDVPDDLPDEDETDEGMLDPEEDT